MHVDQIWPTRTMLLYRCVIESSQHLQTVDYLGTTILDYNWTGIPTFVHQLKVEEVTAFGNCPLVTRIRQRNPDKHQYICSRCKLFQVRTSRPPRQDVFGTSKATYPGRFSACNDIGSIVRTFQRPGAAGMDAPGYLRTLLVSSLDACRSNLAYKNDVAL
jgi:hypothetical protein